ncbi:MAG: triose-phosphate isomerase [Clostridia bacterium]|nr:triose-phosphate isomerase [Clostridia bacterium]
MNKKIIIANWKMNKNLAESINFAKDLIKNNYETDNNIVICPSSICIHDVLQVFSNTNISVGAQNCFWADRGAYTGEISAEMLHEIGVEYVILGHSERRTYLSETNEIINKKILNSLENNLKVILCIGEKTRQNNNINSIFTDIEECLKSVPKNSFNDIIIAYEPVWAIGSGVSLDPENANIICESIQEFTENKYDFCNIKTIYGGSLNPENSKNFLNQPKIDGILVGNASLDLNKFIKIISK